MAAQLASLRAKLSDDPKAARKTTSTPAPAEKKSPEKVAVAEAPPTPLPTPTPESDPEPIPETLSEPAPEIPPAVPLPKSDQAPIPTEDREPVTPDGSRLQRWIGIVADLGLQGIQHALVNNCELVTHEGSRLQLKLEREYESLMQPGTVRQLQAALDRWAGETVTLEIAVAQGPLDTPYRASQAAAEARLADARQAIEQDPVVQRLCRDLDAVIQADSIRPVEGDS